MSTSKRWSRTGGWAVGAAFAAILTVGILLGSGVWSAASASTTLSPNNAEKDASCKVGDAHRNPAFDPVNHYVYVPNPESSNISVLKAPCTVVATISTGFGSEPGAAAFDPSSDDVWVTDYALSEVYVISGTKIIYTFNGLGPYTWLDGPRAIAYDPVDPEEEVGCMVVANYLADNVTLLCSAQSGVYFGFGSYPTGTGPFAISYDPLLNYMLVANYGSGNVTLLEPTTNLFQTLVYEGSITTGSEPVAIAYDPTQGCDYIANLGSNDVTRWCEILAPYAQTNISGFDQPTSLTWSQAKLAVYVTNWGSGGLWAIGGSTGKSIVQKISSVAGIEGSTYDTATNDLYVTNDITNSVYVYST